MHEKNKFKMETEISQPRMNVVIPDCPIIREVEGNESRLLIMSY